MFNPYSGSLPFAAELPGDMPYQAPYSADSLLAEDPQSPRMYRTERLGHSAVKIHEQINLNEALAHKLSLEEMRRVKNAKSQETPSQFSDTPPPPLHDGQRQNAATFHKSPSRSSTQTSVSESAPVPVENPPECQRPPSQEKSPDLGQAYPITHQRTNSLEIPEGGFARSPTPIESRDFCRQCKSVQDSVSFCPACSINYCPAHWDDQPLHEESQQEPAQQSLHGVPHEKTDPRVAKAIMSIIQPAKNHEENVKLHQDDDNTTWFGVQADHSAQLHFHDWGRYEEFLTQSRFANKSCQFPSLITFAGPTGAGKSTIVKAMVKLFRQSECEDPQTPVIGHVENQTVPTSGEVHLYWDSWTLRGPRPLLYADCEGLGGGSRQPVADRVVSGRDKMLTKEKKEKHRQTQNPADHGQYELSSAPKPFGASMFGRSTPPLLRVPASPPPFQTGPNPYGNDQSFHCSATLPATGYSPYSPIEPPDAEDHGWTSGSGKSQRGFPRPIAWAHGPMRNRQFIVENLYPRLLYTFSDVVVLVMRNAKQLENELERLIGWAATAIEKSSNQPMLPFAIIVINAVDNRTDERLLDVSYATTTLLDDLEDAVSKNYVFRKAAQFWQENSRDVFTTKDLLLAYYSGIRIVLVPDKGRPNQVHRQYKVLRREIETAVERSKLKRQNAHMLLSSHQLNPYLQIAYDHFSKTLDDPFDFIKASSAFSEPRQGSNPVLHLIKACIAVWPRASSKDVLSNLAPLVASSIMLDAVRRELPGDMKAVLPAYEDQLKSALKTFFDESWPCEATHPKFNERCVIVRTTHGTKGHQLKNGKVWGGQYYCSMEIGDLEAAFLDTVKAGFKNLFRLIVRAEPGTEKHIAFDIHQNNIIRRHCAFLRGDKQLVSHLICICCLFKVPVHSLICGHIICHDCFVSAAGNPGKVREHVLRLYSCPVCLRTWQGGRAYVEITIKPPTAGIRILSLDGGGIRAIIELTILKMLEERIGLDIPIQEFFDLIVGTSGGGIVALAIGERNMSVRRATRMFKSFAKQAFQARKGADWGWGIGKLIRLRYQSYYESDGLEACLKESFGSELLFGGERQLQSPSRCKVAVTTVDTNKEARLLANYNRLQRTQSLYTFQRFERPHQELSIWEAGRATSAAPGFFKGYFKPSNGHTYWDGALKLNNPVFSAEDERQNIWPESSYTLPDILLSLGTGCFPDASAPAGDPGPRFGINIVSGVKAFYQIGIDAIQSELDCERTWQEYIQRGFPGDVEKSDRFHRLSLPITGSKIELDAVNSIEELEHLTRAYYRDSNLGSNLTSTGPSPSHLLDEIAVQLIASLFYFEVTGVNKLKVFGSIRCRLPQDVDQGGSLTKLALGLRSMRQTYRGFRIFPSTKDYRWSQILIPDDMLDAVAQNEKARFDLPMEFDLVDPAVPSGITMFLDRPHAKEKMISGFPRLVQVREPVNPVISQISLASPQVSLGKSTAGVQHARGQNPPPPPPPPTALTNPPLPDSRRFESTYSKASQFSTPDSVSDNVVPRNGMGFF